MSAVAKIDAPRDSWSPGVSIAGVRIDVRTRAEFIENVAELVSRGGCHVVRFLPADPIGRAGGHPAYRRILNRSALNVPDGMSVVWALRMLGHRAVRLSGTDCMLAVMRWGAPSAVRHGLLGGSDDMVTRLRRRLEWRIHGVRISATEAPPFGPVESMDLPGIGARVRASGVDVLWVGLGVPKQDIAADALARLEAAPVIACVGAAFDFLSGDKRRAPGWMQAAGLEWLHRLFLEPRRLWRRYLVGNAVFAWHVTRGIGGSR